MDRRPPTPWLLLLLMSMLACGGPSRGTLLIDLKTGDVLRSLTGLRLTLLEGERAIQLEVEMGDLIRGPDSAEESAVATLRGQPIVGCTTRRDGDVVDDPRWESEFCARALDELSMRALVDFFR